MLGDTVKLFGESLRAPATKRRPTRVAVAGLTAAGTVTMRADWVSRSQVPTPTLTRWGGMQFTD